MQRPLDSLLILFTLFPTHQQSEHDDEAVFFLGVATRHCLDIHDRFFCPAADHDHDRDYELGRQLGRGTAGTPKRGGTDVATHRLRDETRQYLGTLLGWAIALGGIWLIGAVFKSLARHSMQKRFHKTMEKIPLISVIYKPVSQVVGMLQNDGDDQMKSMSVVYCAFGQAHGGGFLALLAAADVCTFGGRDCRVVYIPTSPVPMSGGIVFVPVEMIQEVDMQVDDLMQIYFSLGVMSPSVVPDAYRRGPKNEVERPAPNSGAEGHVPLRPNRQSPFVGSNTQS